jgi:hypothetical protein
LTIAHAIIIRVKSLVSRRSVRTSRTWTCDRINFSPIHPSLFITHTRWTVKFITFRVHAPRYVSRTRLVEPTRRRTHPCQSPSPFGMSHGFPSLCSWTRLVQDIRKIHRGPSSFCRSCNTLGGSSGRLAGQLECG